MRDNGCRVEIARCDPSQERLTVLCRIADREAEGQLTLEHQRVVEREIGLEVSADDRDGATATGKTDCRCQRFGRPRRLDHHVRAETPRRGSDNIGGLLRGDGCGPEPLGKPATCRDSVDRDQLSGDPCRTHHRHQPNRPAPDHGDHVTGMHAPVLDGAVPGREDVGKEDGRLVRHSIGERAQSAIGVRNPYELGLTAVEPRVYARVPEERASLALSDAPSCAGRAGAVRDHARVDHALARSQRLHVRPDLDDLARELVPEHGACLESGRQAV